MKNIIILKKDREKKKLSGGIMNITILAKVAQASSTIDLTWRYKQAISSLNLNIARKLELTNIKKYWRYVGQVEI